MTVATVKYFISLVFSFVALLPLLIVMVIEGADPIPVTIICLWVMVLSHISLKKSKLIHLQGVLVNQQHVVITQLGEIFEQCEEKTKELMEENPEEFKKLFALIRSNNEKK